MVSDSVKQCYQYFALYLLHNISYLNCSSLPIRHIISEFYIWNFSKKWWLQLGASKRFTKTATTFQATVNSVLTRTRCLLHAHCCAWLPSHTQHGCMYLKVNTSMSYVWSSVHTKLLIPQSNSLLFSCPALFSTPTVYLIIHTNECFEQLYYVY